MRYINLIQMVQFCYSEAASLQIKYALYADEFFLGYLSPGEVKRFSEEATFLSGMRA